MSVKSLNHPVFSEALLGLRDKATLPFAFRELAQRAGFILAVEVTKNLATKQIEVETPITSCVGEKLKNNVVLVPILRAGLSLVEPFHKLIPSAVVGHVGLRRDEKTAKAECYLSKLPDLTGSDVVVLDPMLATGGSAVMALELIFKQKINSVHYASIIGAPEGINKVVQQFPSVCITVGAIDQCLDENFFIVPGLGDFGDRLFG